MFPWLVVAKCVLEITEITWLVVAKCVLEITEIKFISLSIDNVLFLSDRVCKKPLTRETLPSKLSWK